MADQRSKHRLLAMDEVDAADFSDLLRGQFRDIRFVEYEHWLIRRSPGPPYYVNREPPNLQVPYRPSLADPAEWRFRVWREPEGWKPVWSGPNKDGLYFITNEPRVHFVFERGCIYAPTPAVLHCGRIWAYYGVDDREHLQFLNRVWRLSAKLSSNIVQFVDRDTKVPIEAPGRGPVWIGRHAAQWCLEDPRRTIDERVRPPDPSRVAP